MKRFLPSLTLALAGAALPGAAGAQSAADSAGVRAAVLDYVEGIYRVDTARIARSVSPDLAKRGYFVPRNQTEYVSEPMTYLALIEVARTWNKAGKIDPETAPKEIRILDLLDQTASVKLTARWGIDYLHLARYEGRWKIVNVLWQTPPRPRAP